MSDMTEDDLFLTLVNLKEQNAKLQAALVVALKAINDFKDHGTRHDTTPTGRFKQCGCFDSFKGDNWQSYIKSQDEYVRDIARQALFKIEELLNDQAPE